MVYEATPAPVASMTDGPNNDDDAGLPDPLSDDLELRDDRQIVESFLEAVVSTVGPHCLPISCLPRLTSSSSSPLEGVIFPAANDGILDDEVLQQSIDGKTIVAIGCTFKYKMERLAAVQIVEKLQKYTTVCVIAAHLLVQGEQNYCRSNHHRLMRRQKDIVALGVDDVILDPMKDPRRLKLRINLAHYSWTLNQERLQTMLADEPEPPAPEEVQKLEKQLQSLLWEEIPRELMRHLRPMDGNWTESDNHVGDYRFLEKLEPSTLPIWKAVDENGVNVVLKITNKEDVFTPGEVETVYREYRFLAGFTNHPHIITARCCFHSPTKVYTVLEYAGETNLDQHLSSSPGAQLPEQEALRLFYQIGSAIAHCHTKDVAHRSISLRHIILQPSETGELKAKLCDFRTAMVSRTGVTSLVCNAVLPCGSPDMISGEPYLPRTCDQWSMGIVILELVAGRGTFFKVTEVTEGTTVLQDDRPARQALAEKIYAFFEHTADSHRKALAGGGAAICDETHSIISRLLRTVPSRAEIKDIMPPKEEGEEAPAAEPEA